MLTYPTAAHLKSQVDLREIVARFWGQRELNINLSKQAEFGATIAVISAPGADLGRIFRMNTPYKTKRPASGRQPPGHFGNHIHTNPHPFVGILRRGRQRQRREERRVLC